jgi:23S rRNA-intervening sequence protein
MADNARQTGPALEAHQQFLLWLVPTIEKFPRSQKFTLGDRIQSTALDILEALIEATYTRDRRGHLARANLGLEKLRHLFRLAFQLKSLDPRRYEHAARSLDEIGRLVGAWTKLHAAHAGDGFPYGQAAR